MSSPAERYAASRRRREHAVSQLALFERRLDFDLDDFQVRACRALEDGKGVLVAAPTGAGKTVVGEFAVHLGLARGQKAFYTTPIKALSNQKYADLAKRHGAENVGLLTGDSSINGEAPIVVMTTEVLRNMMYTDSTTLRGLGFVVMDEVHYLADRLRGAVWEEVIIHLPRHVQVVSLSATVSNAEEFGAWLGEVRGETEVVVSEHRPVPLWQHMMVGRDLFDLFVEQTDTGEPDPGGIDGGESRSGGAGRASRHRRRAERRSDREREIRATLDPDLLEAIEAMKRSSQRRRGRLEDAGAPRGRRGRPRGGESRGGHGRDRRSHGARRGEADTWSPVDPQTAGPRRGGRPGGLPTRPQVVAALDRAALLPAITFIFSRAGCDAAVEQMIVADMRLIPHEEGERIHDLVEDAVRGIAPGDLVVLGYATFVEGLSRGFAAHHAGMLPAFREIVELLFTQGRIKAVFATETLALGINMPARSVVLEKLVKFNGQTHADITPAEYTQLTGRAGRRGIDVEGHAVVVWNPHMDPLAVGGLASTRTYPLRSSFRPTYNMAVNLVARFGRERTREVLETSFAQFQADRSVVGLNRTIRELTEAMAGYEEAMTCHLGDFTEYAALRRRLADVEKDAGRARAASARLAVDASLAELAPGDVVWLPGRHGGRAVVVTASRGHKGQGAAPQVVTEEARLRRLTTDDVQGPLEPYAHLTVDKGLNPRNAKERRDLAATMRVKIPDEPRDDAARSDGGVDDAPLSPQEREITELRRQLRAHPCHGCSDREAHARWAERWWRAQRERADLERRVGGRTGSVARTFDRVCDLLSARGYLDEAGQEVTELGGRLRHVYTERDLLTAECLRDGLFSGLTPAELAAAVTCLIHEPRRDEGDLLPQMPTHTLDEVHTKMVRLWSGIEDAENDHGLPTTAYPDPGLAPLVYRWASGRSLGVVLRDSDLAAGDFVRRCKQTVDLLDQIADVAPDAKVSLAARKAVDAVMRGVIAADRLD
ncbi:DEAD/DEAH box helicase [Mobilicoccus pelagius]|uniref:Putative ATP-dependent helicase n=1 Tax=Mobilicoccus pelagius NBRC 104925 TaxID=1089455 RepID=H5UTF2_9MICO|nr:DEAD/DEAH box helicase [Mobilicoccus pelagius]GAB49010.1 putative ATP-dependent helicase [Mobilicoccus pelagius NBRC 104925]